MPALSAGHIACFVGGIAVGLLLVTLGVWWLYRWATDRPYRPSLQSEFLDPWS